MNDRRTTALHVLRGGDEVPFVTGTDSVARSDGGLQILRLFQTLRRRLRLISWIVIGGAAAVAGLALLLPTRYTAKAQIVIEESRAQRADQQASGREAGPDQATIQTQVAALASHDLLANAIAQLTADPAFRAIQNRGLGSIPELSLAGSNIMALERIERHLNVFQEAGSHVISIAYASKDPAEAAAIANKITGYYLTAGEDQSRFAQDQAIAVLTRKIDNLHAESVSLEAAVDAYQTQHGVVDANKTSLNDEKLGDLNHQLSSAQSELAAHRTRHTELLALRGPRSDWEPILAGLDSQGLVELHGQVAALLAGRQETIVVIPHAGQDGLEDQADALPLRDKVRNELHQALLKLAHEESVARAQVTAIEHRLSAVQVASDDVRLHDLVAAAASARQRYERLVQRRNELQERGDDVTAPARLLSWAAVPNRPSSLNPLLFLAPGLIAFAVIGCLVALVRDRLDQGIYNSCDVASVLGLRCAGFVPLSPGINQISALSADAAMTSFREALQGMMVSLQLIGLQGPKPQVILVTSSVPGEGKTTLARGLGASAAQMGRKVLLLDMDAVTGFGSTPAPTSLPALENDGRLPEVLAGDRALIERIPTGGGMKLDYLPVRRRPSEEMGALFADGQFSNLLRRQRLNYDLIIIDSAPVLAKAEVRLLAAVADHVVFAVRWGKTRSDDARAALALLANMTQPISAAITQVDLRLARAYMQPGVRAKSF
jgi:succinoglycan biosynthesis transport protein ExoP